MPYKKVSLKWIIGLTVRAKTIKLLDKSVGVNLCDLVLDTVFLGITPKSQLGFVASFNKMIGHLGKNTINKGKKIKLDKLYFLKNQKPLCFKGHHQESEKRTYGMGENICISYIW